MKIALPIVLVCGFLAAPVGRAAADRTDIPSAPDDRVIHHVLNRIGFGARPGDVDRVRAMGLATYIYQQLHPERVQDPAVDARIAQLTTLSMSASEVSEKYFAPARQAQQANQRKQAAADPNMSAGATTPQRSPASPELMEARQNAQRVINELTEAHLVRALMSERQLNEVLRSEEHTSELQS